MIFCTLFNSLYLDKGITLYQSLERVAPDLKLYVLCMDEKCYEILTDLSYKCLTPIRLSDFEGKELLSVKLERSIGEYCWTCTSWLIYYVLTHYQEEYCTYIDADMAFYSDPSVIIEEMKEHGASVLVVEHRFNAYESKRSEKKLGKFCVEFNTFKNDDKGRALLNLWKYQCLTKCTIKDNSGRYWGDQKYIQYWQEDFPSVISTYHRGVGVAPWNMMMYKFNEDNGSIKINHNGNDYPLICCHFEAITYIDENVVNIHAVGNWSKRHDDSVVDLLYRPYLLSIKQNREMLNQKYGINTLVKYHPEIGENTMQKKLTYIVKLFTQTNFLPYFFKYKIPNFLFRKRNIITLE